jgi:hypothetical protein
MSSRQTGHKDVTLAPLVQPRLGRVPTPHFPI